MKNKCISFAILAIILKAMFFMAGSSAMAANSGSGCANDGDPGCPPMATSIPAQNLNAGQLSQEEMVRLSTLSSNPPAEYLSCEKDSDCLVAPANCASSRAINKTHYTAYEYAVRSIAPAIDCPEPRKHPPYAPACDKNVCILKLR